MNLSSCGLHWLAAARWRMRTPTVVSWSGCASKHLSFLGSSATSATWAMRARSAGGAGPIALANVAFSTAAGDMTVSLQLKGSKRWRLMMMPPLDSADDLFDPHDGVYLQSLRPCEATASSRVKSSRVMSSCVKSSCVKSSCVKSSRGVGTNCYVKMLCLSFRVHGCDCFSERRQSNPPS